MSSVSPPQLVQTARLYPPRRGRGVLARPRLENLASELLEYPLTLLKAPPGFGKTTLASAWVDALTAQQVVSLWLTLEESDSSLSHLLYCLTCALERAVPTAKFSSSALCQDMPFVLNELLATAWLNDVDQLGVPVLLVLDDCHCVKQEVLTQCLSLLLRHPLKNLHLLLISRTALSNNLLMLLRGEPHLELDAQTLRFQPAETQALLQRAGIELAHAELEQLQQATAGWGTALRAYMLSNRKAFSAVPRSLNLLFDEMLAGQTAEFLAKLLPLGLLESFSQPMLEHCFEAPMQEFVAYLEQGQFFLNIKGEQGQWLSFHPLFQDYLAQRYLQQVGAECANAFRLRAAHWLAQQQDWIPAISLALNANASQQAELWISQCAMDLVEQGELYTLMQWERQLREQLLSLPPVMRLALGWASCLAMQQDKARALLVSLKDESSVNPWDRRALSAMLLAFDGRSEQAAQLAYQCVPHFLAKPWIANVLVNIQRYGHMNSGNWQAFYSLPALISQPLSRRRYLFNLLYQHSIEALAEIIQCRLATAVQRLDEVIKTLSEHHANNQMLLSLPNIFLAHIRLLQGRYDEAQKQLDICHLLTVKMGFPELIIAAQGTRAKLYRQQNNAFAARQILAEIENTGLKRLCPKLLSFAVLERCRLSLQEGKFEEAKACAHFLQQLQKQQQQPPLELHYAATLTTLLLASFQREPLVDLVRQVDALAQQLSHSGKQLLHLELQLAVACAQQAQGDPQGEQRLAQWLPVAQVYGLTGLINDYGFGESNAQSEKIQQQALLSLTVKERLILQEVAQGQSNKMIAKNMGVAPETVKSHLKNIFSKLGVNNRTQAALFVQE